MYGFSKMKIQKLKNFRRTLTKNTADFCQSTTLHGMKYVADKELRWCERCFFGISIITATTILVCLILNVYDKWYTSPVIVGINPKRTLIALEPFPAVTICNLNLALKSKVSKISKNSTEYIMLRLLCKRKVHKEVHTSIKNWNNLENFIINISQSCQDMIQDCRFGGRSFNCSELFQPLITDGGYCCVFNMLHPLHMYTSKNRMPTTMHSFKADYMKFRYINWSAENGYFNNVNGINREKVLYPQTIPGVGESLGLSITLNAQKNQYYCSSSSSVGFKLALHASNEGPSVKELGVYIEPGKETKIHIKPDKTETNENLKSIDPEYRGCFFANEFRLKSFAHYTQRNCEMEYASDVFHLISNCTVFYMPKVYENLSTCSPYQRSIQGIRNAIGIYNLFECLPSCNELNLHIDAFSTKLLHKGFHVSNKIVKHLNDSHVQDNIAVVHMFFKENSFRTHKQMEFIGLSDFVASIGGLMGLFLGFSFLSISELIYFGILRPIRSVVEYCKKLKNAHYHLDNSVRQLSLSLRKKNKMRKLLQNRHDRFLKRSKVFDQNVFIIPNQNIIAMKNNMYDKWEDY